MKLLPTQTDEASLLQFGREAVARFEKCDFQALAVRFGYALAFGRNPAVAIEEDFLSCIAEFRASSEQWPVVVPSMNVRYLSQNNLNLFADVDCVFLSAESCPILATLIVSLSGQDKHVTLEDIVLRWA